MTAPLLLRHRLPAKDVSASRTSNQADDRREDGQKQILVALKRVNHPTEEDQTEDQGAKEDRVPVLEAPFNT